LAQALSAFALIKRLAVAGSLLSHDSTHFNLAAIPQSCRATAQLIVDQFAEAGFGLIQQAAAVANAMNESLCEPNAILFDGPEHGYNVGIFQLRAGAPGTERSVDKLKDPLTNIGVAIARAKQNQQFAKATDLRDAATIFVRAFERPADPAPAVQKQFYIARQLLAPK
jgi:hypothetical protein